MNFRQLFPIVHTLAQIVMCFQHLWFTGCKLCWHFTHYHPLILQDNLPSTEQKGYTNHEALQRLHTEMSKEINSQEDKEKQQSSGSLCKSLDPSQIQSTFHWSGCFIVATIAILLLVTFGISTQK